MKMFFIKDKVKKLIQQVLYIQSSTPPHPSQKKNEKRKQKMSI
jgi:hypothetical protein